MMYAGRARAHASLCVSRVCMCVRRKIFHDSLRRRRRGDGRAVSTAAGC